MGGFIGLYLWEEPLYYLLLRWLGFAPFPYPFLDGQSVLAGVECWHHGIDVYVSDPCDVLGRLHVYSPLWLRLPVIPMAWTAPLGLLLAGAFFLSLGLLPPPRRGWDLAATLLAAASPATAYAVERANIDLIMFLLAMAAGVLALRRWPARLPSYLVILLAGFLKFYPLAALVLSLRERPRIFLAVNAAAFAAVVAFIAGFHGELKEMAPNIPNGSYYTDFVGATNLPHGIAELIVPRLPAGSTLAALVSDYLPIGLGALLIVLAIGRVVQGAAAPELRRLAAGLSEPEAVFLIIGASIIGGCFFAGQSVAYRGIFLLFVLPALLTLRRAAERPGERTLLASGCIGVVLLMWEGCFRHAIYTLAPDAVARCWWLARELLWWYVVGFLAALSCCAVQKWELIRQMRLGMPAVMPR